MTIKEFVDTNWHRGNVVRLKNGKEYLVKGTKGHGRWLLLYSEEYDAKFVADYRIVDCRTSDYEEPEEVYLEKKRSIRKKLQPSVRLNVRNISVPRQSVSRRILKLRNVHIRKHWQEKLQRQKNNQNQRKPRKLSQKLSQNL